MEQPRPQPKASFTLFYFLFFATLAQLTGDWLSPPATDKQEESFDDKVEESAPHDSFWVSVGSALRWAPANADAFLPSLLRSQRPVENVMIVEEVSDDLLISTLSESTEDGGIETNPQSSEDRPLTYLQNSRASG